MSGEAAVFMRDIFENTKHAEREYINADAVLENFTSSGRFSRKSWALMSLELWQQEYHDRASHYRHLLSR
jgi:asparagine synthase (glutamine-hydrolysing)